MVKQGWPARTLRLETAAPSSLQRRETDAFGGVTGSGAAWFSSVDGALFHSLPEPPLRGADPSCPASGTRAQAPVEFRRHAQHQIRGVWFLLLLVAQPTEPPFHRELRRVMRQPDIDDRPVFSDLVRPAGKRAGFFLLREGVPSFPPIPMAPGPSPLNGITLSSG